MELILLKDVTTLGKRGDLVTVKDGYARNYLLPGGLAKPNTPGNLKLVERLKALEASRAEEERNVAKDLEKRLGSVSCTVRMKAGEDDKLFGAVTAQDIVTALKLEGITLDRKKIILEQPIKSLGVFQTPVRLHPDVTATLKVWVVKE